MLLTGLHNPLVLAACVDVGFQTLLVGVGKSPHPLLVASAFGFGIPSVEDAFEAAVIGKLLQFDNGGGEFTSCIVRGKLLGGMVPSGFLVKARQLEGSNGQGGSVGGCALQSARGHNQVGDAVVLSSG